MSNSKARVLVVDDAEMNRDVLTRRLRRHGYEVEEADHGSKVLPALERTPFDLILLDVMMPDLSGIEVLKMLRERHSVTELPVIMLSARDESEVMVEAFQNGANDYITKPIDFPVTLARIEAHLSRRPRAHPAGGDQTQVVNPLSGGAASNAEDIPNGTLLGSYTIRGVLGRGGMGVVYDAENLRLGRQAAVKVLNRQCQTGSQWAARFEREAKAVARIEHPNVVMIYDVGEWHGRPYIAMQKVEGTAAGELVRRNGRLPWQEATRLALEATRGLAAAHERGVLHRDIKPDNIIVGTDGGVKLLDFGLAKLSDGVEDVTIDGTVLGTPHFMSPEQCLGEALDARSDLYQMGATLHTLVTGRYPYAQHSMFFKIMNAHCNEPVPDPQGEFPDLPRALCDFIMKAMQKNREDRYQDSKEFIEALEAASS